MAARNSSYPLTRLASLATAVTLSALAPESFATVGPPRALSIVPEPGKPDHTILRSDVWGLFRTVDGGKSWQWICAEAFGGDSYAADNRRVRIAPGGRIFVASSFDGLWSSADACDWAEQPQFTDELVADVTLQNTDVVVLTSTGRATGGIDGNVWRSVDNGGTFTKIGSPLPTDLATSNVAFAPGTPDTLYVSAEVIDAPDGASDALISSTDGGTTWERHLLPVNVPGATLRIHGVHPTQPGTVFLWVDLNDRLNQDSPDELWVATDFGATVKRVYAAAGDLPGFAISPDGANLLVSGPLEGVQKAALSDAMTTGQAAFQQTFDGQVWGLSFQGETLFAGHNDFTPRPLPRFTYGKSSDQSSTFSEVMNICQAEIASCGADSTIERRCREILTAPRGFDDDYLSGPRCAAPASPPDAGARPAADAGARPGTDGNPKAAEGCSSTPSGGVPTLPAVTAILLALGLGAALRRRDRPQS